MKKEKVSQKCDVTTSEKDIAVILAENNNLKIENERIKDENNAYSTMIDNPMYGLHILQDDREVFVNSTYANLLGYTKEELFALSSEKVKSLFHPDDQVFVWEYIEKSLENNTQPQYYECRGIRKDGSVIWFEAYSIQIKFKGKLACLQCIKDITEQKKTKEKFQQTKELVDNILIVSPIAICYVNNKKILWVNDNMRKMFGFENESDVIHQSIEKIFSNHYDYDTIKKIASQKSYAEKVSYEEIQMLRKNGSTFIGSVYMTCSDYLNPMQNAFIAISDITLQKQAEQDRIINEKLQDFLKKAGSICHELNQPMMAISGYAELLLLSDSENTPQNIKISKIREQVSRMGNITKRLMQFFKHDIRSSIGNGPLDKQIGT